MFPPISFSFFVLLLNMTLSTSTGIAVLVSLCCYRMKVYNPQSNALFQFLCVVTALNHPIQGGNSVLVSLCCYFTITENVCFQTTFQFLCVVTSESEISNTDLYVVLVSLCCYLQSNIMKLQIGKGFSFFVLLHFIG